MQTVRAYETSGGAYIVARENLGTLPSLVGAAALLTDYVLTVAVSISAGIFAVTSFAPSLAGHKVALSLGCLLVIVLANLRGVRESGSALRAPDLSLRHGGRSARRRGRRRARDRPRAPRGRAARAAGGHWNDHAIRAPARLLVRLDRADRRGGDRERRQRVPQAARQECSGHAGHSRLDRDLPLPGRLVSRGASARATELDRVRRLADRARCLPGRFCRELHVLRHPGSDAACPDPGREHVVPGLSAPFGAAGPRRLRAAAVHEPRRPSRLLERDARAGDGRRPAAAGSTARTRTTSSTST